MKNQLKEKIRTRMPDSEKPIESGIIIPGSPIAQKRHRYRRNGKQIISYDPSSKEKTMVRKTMSYEWANNPMTEPLAVVMTFYCSRPKSQYRSGKYSNILKEDAPVLKTSKPDVDNYIKFYMDCGNGILWGDDAQVVRIEAWKRYADDKGARVEMEVWAI